MTKPAILMTGPMMAMIMDQLDEAFDVTRLWTSDDKQAALQAVAAQIEGIATAGHAPVDSAFMQQCPKLKIVANFGVGYDTVDAAWAGDNGIIVTNTPDVLSDEVADTTIGLTLMTTRELGRAEQYLRAGEWVRSGNYPLTNASMQNRTFGIVGLGRIGKAIAKRIEGFGRPIAYFGRNRQDNVGYRYYDNLGEMAGAVDTLIVITPGGPATANLINAEVLAALGTRGILINVSRGSVVDEPALIKALQDGTIYAAGLDVFANEPQVPDELLAMPNVVVLPHVASASVHTRNQMGQLVVDNMKSLIAGTPPLTPVAETPFESW